jgi:hypothetical protein
MKFKFTAVIHAFIWSVLPVAADPYFNLDQLSPLEKVLLVTPAGHFVSVSIGADSMLRSVGPLSPPDTADVLGIVLPAPIAPWRPSSPPPTMVDVIGMVKLANWNPFDPLTPDWLLSGSLNASTAEVFAAYRAQNLANQAQTKQNNIQKLIAFSEAVRANLEIALDPERSVFGELAISEFNRDGGLLKSEFQWGRGDIAYVDSGFAKVQTLQSGFFGE